MTESPPKPSPPKSPLHRVNRAIGWSYVIGGMAIMLLGPAASFLALDRGGFLARIVIIVSLTGGFAMILNGRRHFVRGGQHVLDNDPRPPILYLRQFSDDGALYGTSFWRSRRRLSLRSRYARTYEERIALALKKVGPLVAIGRPDEELPALGAARIYVGDDAWQAKVDELIARASVVLLQIGETEGIRWEVERLVGRVPPHKLVLCLPMDEKSGERAQEARYRRFVTRNGGVFPRSLPQDIGEAQFIYFDEDWTPRLLIPRGTSRNAIWRGDDAAGRLVLRRALSALNEEFLRVSTPYGLRAALAMVGFVLGTIIGGIMLWQTAAGIIDEVENTTLDGRLASIDSLLDEATPQAENLRLLLEGVAQTLGAPGSLDVPATPRRLNPPPLYDEPQRRFNTALMMAPELTALGARSDHDLIFGDDFGTLMRWIFVSRPYRSESRASADTKRMIAEALDTRYLGVVRFIRAVRPSDRPDSRSKGRVEFELAFIDLHEKIVLAAYPLVVTGDDFEDPPERRLPSRNAAERARMDRQVDELMGRDPNSRPVRTYPSAWEESATLHLQTRMRAAVLQSFADLTGGTFIGKPW